MINCSGTDFTKEDNMICIIVSYFFLGIMVALYGYSKDIEHNSYYEWRYSVVRVVCWPFFMYLYIDLFFKLKNKK